MCACVILVGNIEVGMFHSQLEVYFCLNLREVLRIGSRDIIRIYCVAVEGIVEGGGGETKLFITSFSHTPTHDVIRIYSSGMENNHFAILFISILCK